MTVKRYALWCLPFVLFIACAFSFVGWHNWYGKRLVDEGMRYGAANAVKHAYASYSLYQILHRLGFSAEAAKRTTLWLGDQNEYLERYTKWRSQDPTVEVMKDLHNNVAGVTAAQWNDAQQNPKNGRELIHFLAQQKALLTRHRMIKRTYANTLEGAPQQGQERVDFAIEWRDSQRDHIAQKVQQSLQHFSDQQ